jgi:hypothetical protein
MSNHAMMSDLKTAFPILLRHGRAVELMEKLGFSNRRETLAKLAKAGTVGTRYPEGPGTRAYYVRDDILAAAPKSEPALLP